GNRHPPPPRRLRSRRRDADTQPSCQDRCHSQAIFLADTTQGEHALSVTFQESPNMSNAGWFQLIPSSDLYRGPGRYPIDAYSEFMPPPRLAWKPYGKEPPDPQLFDPEDPWGWYISEYEEANELHPGLEQIARQVVGRVRHLLHGEHAHGISRRHLTDNGYWSHELEEHVGKLPHDHCVVLLPLALSRTQDDKGRLRWTLFGGSEQGPARVLGKRSRAPRERREAGWGGRGFFPLLRGTVSRKTVEGGGGLPPVGFRALPPALPLLPWWEEPPHPWAKPFLIDDGT